MLGQLLWLGRGLPSWEAEGLMTLLGATVQTLSARMGSLLSLHSLPGKRLQPARQGGSAQGDRE